MSEENTPQMVPLSRLQAAIEARREAEAKAKELAAEVERLTPLAASVDEVTKALEAERAARAEDAARFAARESFVRAGMDPEADADAMEVIRSRWERLPKKDRPSLGEWLKNGAQDDRIAGALLPKPAAEAQPEAPAQSDAAAEPVAQPRATMTNAGAQPPPPAGPRMSKAEYQAGLVKYKHDKEALASHMAAYFGD